MRLVQWKGITASVLTISLAALAPAAEPVPFKPAQEMMTDDGPVLVSPTGMTLYIYGPDATTPGKSQCSHIPKTTWQDTQTDFGRLPVIRPEAQKSCTQKWPPYLADTNARPSGDFAFIQRTEGGKQWTWRGKPLYFSIKDQKPGDRNGAPFQTGIARRGWALAGPNVVLVTDLRIIRLDDSLAISTANLRPVYTPMNTARARRAAACRDCATIFNPVLAPHLAQIGGDWSTVDAGPGRKQFAYKGKPLFLPPDEMTDQEIVESGEWEPVLFRKGQGRPDEIDTRPSLIGDVYTDEEGRTLYQFGCGTPTNDGVRCNDPGDPAGYWAALCGTAEECAKQWRLYRAPSNARPKGDWTVVDVAAPLYTDPRGFTYPPDVPRVKAWAYRGNPVYTYFRDNRAGDVRGHWIQWLGFSRFDAVQVPGRGER